MPHRAQRRRNQEAREAPAKAAAELEHILDFAENSLMVRRTFVAEAIASDGLVSLTFRPRGESNYLNVYGGAFTGNGFSKLSGDGILATWSLPVLHGFRVRFDASDALIARTEPSFNAIDITDIWLRTADQTQNPDISIAEAGPEEGIVVSRAGFDVLAKTIGHNVLAQGLQYIGSQLYLPQAELTVTV